MMNPSAIQLIELRKHLHRHPELSGAEHETAGYIKTFLKQLPLPHLTRKVGGDGLLVTIDSGKAGPSVLFRSELDALPIQETNEFAHKSVIPGVSHKCGHDGHMAILCGLAQKLSVNPPANGKVYLLFQPAEETGEGAVKVVHDTQFDIKPDYVFALHNLPGYASGTVVIKDGSFTAAVNSLIINLKGKTTHAAEPQAGINPALAISEIIQYAQLLNQPDSTRDDFSLVTPVCIRMGEPAYGTAAGEASLHFTLRSWSDAALKKLEQDLIQKTAGIAMIHGLNLEHSFTQSFHATVNDPGANELVRDAAANCNLEMISADHPFKWGEDFGYFTSKFKGCMFGLGAGFNQPALHNPDYDFPDELVETGSCLFYSITNKLLHSCV